MKNLAASVEKYYSDWTGFEAVIENLKRKGIDLATVRAQDLYAYDQAHAGGIAATAKLAQRAAINPGATVIDVGCGIGGTARYLHAEFSCRVLGIDLTPARLRAGMELNRLVGFQGIDLLAAQADALPFPASFADMVLTQHLTMNLPDHRSFVRECARVLKPGGRLAVHEWFLARSGSASSPLLYPLPWAPNPTLNHAVSSSEFLSMLHDECFIEVAEDVTAAMVARLEKDVQALTSHGASEQRLAAHRNLIKAATDGVLHCLMITAERQ
jgi:SAM-dependent methyltransferase